MNDIDGRARDFIANNSLFLYFTVTFLISWICWAISFSLKSPDLVLDKFWLISQIGVFAPSITAIVFYSLQHRDNSFRKSLSLLSPYLLLVVLGLIITKYEAGDLSLLPEWLAIIIILFASMVFLFFLLLGKILYSGQTRKISIRRLCLALLSSWLFYPMLFIVAWFLVHLMIGNPSVSIFERQYTSVVFLVIVTVTFDFLFGGSVGEEIGWRGYALPLLLKKYNPVNASVILGIIWSLWHLPIDIVAGFGYLGVGGIVLRMLMAVPMSIIFTWFYIRSKYGVVAALLLHSGVNIIPAFGFSNYELAFGILIMFQIIIASVIVLCDKTFQVFGERQSKGGVS